MLLAYLPLFFSFLSQFQYRSNSIQFQLRVVDAAFGFLLMHVCLFISTPVFSSLGMAASDKAAFQHPKRCRGINWPPRTASRIWFQSRLGIPLCRWKLSEIPLAQFLSFIVQNQTDRLFSEREKRKKFKSHPCATQMADCRAVTIN